MRIKKLILKNFQGIKALEINADNGENINIYGDNGTGKSTAANAISWLIYGKPHENIPNFSPKTLEDGLPVHYLEHSVEGVFSTEYNGNVILKKIFKEKWVKQRGSEEKLFSGHETIYEFDGVPCKEKDYIERLGEIVDLDRSKLLTDPRYFSETLSWQDRRKILLNVFGDVDDNEVLAADSKLSEMASWVTKKSLVETVADIILTCKSEISKSNKMLTEIPARIDELTMSTNDVLGINIGEINAKITNMNKNIDNTKLALSGQANPLIDELSKELAAMEVKRGEDLQGKNFKLRSEQLEIKNELSKIENNISIMKNDLGQKRTQVATLKTSLADLRLKFLEIAEQKFAGDNLCPTCKQQMPKEILLEAEKSYKENQAKKLAEIQTKGKEDKEFLTRLTEVSEKIENEIIETEPQLIAKVEQLKQNSEALEKLQEERKTIPIEQENLAKQIKTLQEIPASQDKQILQDELQEQEAEVEYLRKQLSDYEQASKNHKRIEELKAEEKKISANILTLEKKIMLCELFNRMRARALSEKINSEFKNVKFSLYKTQINGGQIDDCEVLANGANGWVPYSLAANNALRINAGLEIISVLSEKYNQHVPVVIDNAESVTKYTEIKSQVIKCFVKANVKKLKIETESGNNG